MESASGGTEYGPQDRGSRFRGLDDYSEYPKIQSKKKRNNTNINDVIDPNTGFVLTENSFAEFYIIERIDNNKSFEQVSPFVIEKALTSYIGAHHETKRLRNGTLLVKCKNEKQAKLLMNFNNMLFANTFKVKVIEHETLNTVQGLVYCWDSKFLSEEEILEGLTEQKVVAVRKIKRKVGDSVVETALCILTFKRSLLPNSIKFGFHSVLVKPYIPNPLRCLNCFRFGHTRKNCKSERVCAQCSASFHEPESCLTGSRCVNCKGAHSNWNKECPQYIREMGIQTIKIQEKLSYFEAKKRYDSFPRTQHLLSSNTHQKETYTQALKTQTLTNDKTRQTTKSDSQIINKIQQIKSAVETGTIPKQHDRQTINTNECISANQNLIPLPTTEKTQNTTQTTTTEIENIQKDETNNQNKPHQSRQNIRNIQNIQKYNTRSHTRSRSPKIQCDSNKDSSS